MLRYCLVIAFRSLINNRLCSIISIVGLAVGMTACSFILLWVQDEKSYDRFHAMPDEIYMGIAHFTDGGMNQVIKTTTGLFAPAAKENFSEVKSYCRIRSFKTGFVQAENRNTRGKEAIVTDSTFFSFFNFPLVTGSSQNLFHKPDEVVISESLAREMFGDDDPVGKMIHINGEKACLVAAVMKDFPANTYLPRADLVIHWQSDPEDYLYLSLWNDWGSCEFLSFIRLEKGTNIKQLAKEITDLQTRTRESRYFTLQPLVNLHLYTLEGEPAGIKTVWIFTGIACIILVISCINYVNLVTGRSAKKNHEVGLRKVFGAQKVSLFFQLMTEAVVLFLIASVVAMLLTGLLSEGFNQLSGKEIYFGWNSGNIWMLYGFIFLAVSTLAGIYPALSLSSFKLTNLLQRNLTNKKGDVFRKVLVVVQFIASSVLIAATVTLSAQLSYIRRINLGFDQEQVFTCQTRDMAGEYRTVKEELMRNPVIRSVTGASDRISDISRTNSTQNWERKTGDGSVSYYRLFVDSTFFNNMAMTFAEGSGFRPGVKTFAMGTGFEPGEENQFIINETLAKDMGLTEPVVGQWMEADHSRGTIVGVVKDFHFNSFYEKISPLVLFYSPDWASTLYIRTTAQDAGRAVALVENLWKKYNPNDTFEYSFMDQSFERLYRSDVRTGQLFGVFAFIAVLISCLGLFGLVSYAAEAKTKEIGIRKVHGAGVSDIVTMLSKEFLLLVGIAMLIAFPLSYYWLDKLLQNFAYRISIGWQIFALTGIITILLTLLTVGWRAISAARVNPVKSIKTE